MGPSLVREGLTSYSVPSQASRGDDLGFGERLPGLAAPGGRRVTGVAGWPGGRHCGDRGTGTGRVRGRVRRAREFAGASNLGDTFGFGEDSMRLTYALFALGIAAACGDDDYPTPAGGLDGRMADAPTIDASTDTPD